MASDSVALDRFEYVDLQSPLSTLTIPDTCLVVDQGFRAAPCMHVHVDRAGFSASVDTGVLLDFVWQDWLLWVAYFTSRAPLFVIMEFCESECLQMDSLDSFPNFHRCMPDATAHAAQHHPPCYALPFPLPPGSLRLSHTCRYDSPIHSNSRCILSTNKS